MDKPASTSAVRMAGYLEKRGKMKVVSTWKKYWFVLEGQLLLYYKSQLEYINLSACRGSLNIGLASCVRPGQSLTIQVVTRTQCLTLRSKERFLQEQWLQALVDSMALPNTTCSLKRPQSQGPQHFRYSLDNLPAVQEDDESTSEESTEKKSTMPRRVSRRDSMLQRIKRMGGISYANNRTDNGTKHKELSKSLSTSMIETLSSGPPEMEESQPLDSQETFKNNLKTVRDLLQMSKPEDIVQPDSISVVEVNIGKESRDVPDENQNKSDQTHRESMNENNYCYESLQISDQKEGDEYYSTYDVVQLMSNLPLDDKEPDLPPRPKAVSIVNDQSSEYEELDLVQCSPVNEKSPKKHNFRDAIFFRDFRHKTKQLDTDGNEIKKKRKPSFLKKLVMRRGKKKAVVDGEIEKAESDEDPLYDSVSYQTQFEQQVMPTEIIDEFKSKKELKHNQETNSDEDSEDYETIYSTGSDERATSKRNESDSDHNTGIPVISLHVSAEHLYAESSKSIPSLPPRRTKRPPSPWHDIPTNNAPCEFLTAPDEILNTPQGFRFIQDQWRTREWSREQQQVAFSCKSLSKTSINETNQEDSLTTGGQSDKDNNKERAEPSDNNQLDSLEKDKPQPDVPVGSPVQLRSQSKESVAPSTNDENENQEIVGINRYSDELHLLLAQLAEITSAPLFHIGATKSLMAPTTLTLDEELGPIRRRRHSDPDYDIPRPHGSLQLIIRDTPDTSISPDSLELCIQE